MRIIFAPENYIPTSHYVSATETNRLMLFGDTVAVYCEIHAERCWHSIRLFKVDARGIYGGGGGICGVYGYL
jgi:hypothetical protein